MDQDRLTYTRNADSREATQIGFDIPADMTVQEYKTICIRMAHALGYNHNSISDTFRIDDNQKPDMNQLKLLFD